MNGGQRFVGSMPRMTPLARALAIGLVVVFVLGLILDVWVRVEQWTGTPVFLLLALDPSRLGIPTAWQLLTYVAAIPPDPSGVVSLGFSVLFLWWMVAPFEERYGTRRALQLTVLAILGGSIPGLAAGLLFPSLLAGTSPVILAFLAAFAFSLRDQPVSLFGLFTMRAIQMLWLSIGISVLMFLASKNVVSLAADLGAIGVGVLFVKWMTRPRTPKKPPTKRKPPHGLRVIEGGEGDGKPKWLN